MSGTTLGWWVVIGLGVVTWFGCCGWIVYDWRRQRRRADDEGQPMLVDHGCEGCRGQGPHRRWCSAVVGPSASYLGVLSQDAEVLADQIGTDVPDAAQACYLAALLLRDRAIVLRHEFEKQGVESNEAPQARSGVRPSGAVGA
jgi:hypothetical protein